jgi:4-amino-4-deoxy-L-arabinose transferase-like glycosyltransferase
MPYRDAWDFKGPLTFYVFAALQFVFGTQMWAIRLLDLALLAGAAVAGARIVSQFAGRIAAAWTVLMMVLVFASFGNWYTGQPDGWAANLLVVVAALLITREPVSAGRAAIAGLLIGATALLKPLYGGYLLLVLCAAWPKSRGELADSLRKLGAALAAFAAPIVVTVVWFIAHGALADLIDVHLRFNFERMATDPYLQMPWWRVVQSSLGVVTSVSKLACVLPPAVFGAALVLRERRRTGVVFILWLVISLGLVGAQRKFSLQNYSWHPICAPLAILGGIGLARLWRLAAASEELRLMRWLVVATAAVLFKLAAHDPVAQIARWSSYAVGRTTLAQYRAAFDVDIPALNGASANVVGFSVSRDIQLSEYLREHTAPTDEVLVWSDPLVNYLSDRPAITPITIAHAFTTWGTNERRRRYRSDLLSRMVSEHATYFGVPEKDLAPGTDETNLPAHFPELAQLLATKYEPAVRIGDVELFKRRTTTPGVEPENGEK